MAEPPSSDTVLVALGNPLMKDEGVAIHVLRRLLERGVGGVQTVDAGTSGLSVLHAIAHRGRAIIVDCAIMGCAPGDIRRFAPSEVRSTQPVPRLSTHEGDLIQIVRLASEIGEAPRDIVIYGIEPADISPGTELSPALEARLADYCEIIARDIWGCREANPGHRASD